MSRLRLLVLALLATGALAGCGDELQDANDAIDRTQEQVDQAQDTINDPLGAAEREAQERLNEADRALEDAVSPEDQP
jgi:outer membrane lipopolysaccharide assembly protein LptE/RlpB